VLAPRLLERLHRQSGAARWQVSVGRFGAALTASLEKASVTSPSDIETHLEGLHLADLALACACADGHDAAWEHFILEQRPVLYRAAGAIDPSGGARDLADAIYADLYGVPKDGGERKSLFRYFHGRSSLSTWLRAVLAQRHVDRLRSARRTDALPEDESPAAIPAPSQPPDPDRAPRVTRMLRVLAHAVAGLAPNDRLRMCCYYAQDLTLAQTGKLLGEHEATVSRQLARVRREIRAEAERLLKSEGLTEAQISECFAAIAEDAGPLDLGRLLAPLQSPERPTIAGRKKAAPDRSEGR
jgi:RNA polymerase sigma-70 factor (ECF subfamily)